MTALTAQIAEVLRAHTYVGGGYPACKCGWEEAAPHATHVAQRVVEALQLVQENRTLTDGWIQPTRNAGYYAAGMEPSPAVITHERRWVSAWEEEP